MHTDNAKKYTLDQAANIIGISRKTLDDYYLQLRRAEELGFNFEENKNKKMGVLRKFVKEKNEEARINQMKNCNNNNENSLQFR